MRSPGVYYEDQIDKAGKHLFSTTVIPNRGAWLEYETDSNDVFYVRVDRTRKVPITVLIRALGVGTNQQIIDLFVCLMCCTGSFRIWLSFFIFTGQKFHDLNVFRNFFPKFFADTDGSDRHQIISTYNTVNLRISL